MFKKIILIIIALLTVLAYFVGSYFVDFALKRHIDGKLSAEDYLNNPASAVNIPDVDNEAWTITSQDGLKLAATHLIPNRHSHQWVILVHGYGCDQRYSWDYAPAYLKNNFDVLTPDLRAFGLSEGEYLTMGVKESDDILLWVEKIIEVDPQAQIILHGVSMGAATVMLTAAKENLPKNVIAVVEDCGYTSAYDIFADQLEKIFNLPRFPIMNFVDIVSDYKIGVKISQAAPIDHVKDIKIPILFIHGTADKLVPYYMMQRLYDSCGSPAKDMETFEDVGHASAKLSDPDRYYNKIFSFVAPYIKKI